MVIAEAMARAMAEAMTGVMADPTGSRGSQAKPLCIYFPSIPYLGVGDPCELRSGAPRQWMALRAVAAGDLA